MKVAEALKVMDAGWVKKKKGYRVYFETVSGDTCTPDMMPGEKDPPLTSDVVAWRSAWKLTQASHPENPQLDGAQLVNITVVDDEGKPVPYYATGSYKIFNRREA